MAGLFSGRLPLTLSGTKQKDHARVFEESPETLAFKNNPMCMALETVFDLSSNAAPVLESILSHVCLTIV